MRRPAGPAYSLLRERPGGNVVVGIAQLGLADHVVRILVSCENRPRLLVSRRCEDHVVECFIANCCYTEVSIDTQCIDSNLESGRYISRVGRASRFLSLVLPTAVRYQLVPVP